MHALECVTDSRKKRIGLRGRDAAEQPLQRRVDRKRRAARVGAEDRPDAREVVVESRCGREVQFAVGADELRFVAEEIGLRRSADASEQRVNAFVAEVHGQLNFFGSTAGCDASCCAGAVCAPSGAGGAGARLKTKSLNRS